MLVCFCVFECVILHEYAVTFGCMYLCNLLFSMCSFDFVASISLISKSVHQHMLFNFRDILLSIRKVNGQETTPFAIVSSHLILAKDTFVKSILTVS